MNVAWEPEHDARLIVLRGDGISTSNIAATLNREFKTAYTRSAVCGRAHRLHLPPIPREMRPNHGVMRVKKFKQPSAPKAPKPKLNNLAAVNHLHRKPVRPIVEAPAVVDASKARPWTERRFGQCAYPISGEGADTFSCCQPAGDRGYCEPHNAIMRVKPKEVGSRYGRSLRRWAA